jgi:hypothetical protein
MQNIVSNLLVVLNAKDLAAARQIVAQLGPTQVCVFDPTLIDPATEAQLGPVEYMAWPEAPPYREMSAQAHRLTRLLGQELEAAVQPLWPDLSIGAWQHLNLYYLHMALLWYGPLFEAMAQRLAGRTLHVVLCDKPQSFYFASFVPAVLLLLQAQHSGIPFHAYNYGRQADDAPQVPALHGRHEADGKPFLLTHLPTCFYDIGYFNAEIAATGKAVVNLHSQLWDVPVRADIEVATVPAAAMQAAISAADGERIAWVVQALAAPLDAHLTRWLTAPAYRARQVAQLQDVFRAQLLSLALLEQHFAGALPARLLLSDHDTGLHGPLEAFARHHRRPMVLVPHSKTSTDLEFHLHDATVLYHPIQGETVYDVAQQRPAQYILDYPLSLQFDTALPAPVRTVGLLLNGLALNGVPGADLAAYLHGIHRIVHWCTERGLTLIVRSRPGQSLQRLLVEQAALTAAQVADSVQGTMAGFAQRCDLCLMYDAPTSGALELLTRGIAILNPVASALTRRETGTITAEVVPRADVTTTLDHASALVADVLELQRFRKQQVLAFVRRFGEGRALRSFL